MKNTRICTNCGKRFTEEFMIKNGNEWLCEDCFNELYFICDCCGAVIPAEQATQINHGLTDERYVCLSCRIANCFYCDNCGRYYSNSHLWDSDDETYICEGCSTFYHICYDCEAIVHEDDSYYHNGHYYCRYCYDEIRNDLSSYVNDYYYKPDPEFLGECDDGLFIGVELEVDNGNAFSAAEHIYNNFEEVYLKHDGSLT